MKALSLSVLICLATNFQAFPATDNDINARIEIALRAGNAKELAKLFNKNIDLSIPGNEGVYSKAQAELILKDFFSKNNPKSYTTLHKGTSKDGAGYTIGNLATEGGDYRTYFYLKKTGEDYLIHEFSLSMEENDR